MQPREALRNLYRRPAPHSLVNRGDNVRGWPRHQIPSKMSGSRRTSRLSQQRSLHELANRLSSTLLYFSKNAVSGVSLQATPHCKKHFKPPRSVSTCCEFLSSKPIHTNLRQADDWAMAQSTLWLCQGDRSDSAPSRHSRETHVSVKLASIGWPKNVVDAISMGRHARQTPISHRS